MKANIRHATTGLLYLILGASLGYSIYIPLSQRIPINIIWLKIAVFAFISLVSSAVIYLLRAFLLPDTWKNWSWKQKTIRIIYTLIFTFIIMMLGIIPYDDGRFVTLSISVPQQNELTTFYCTGLFNRYKQRIISPQKIAAESNLFTNIKLVNNKDAIWSRMPDMGTSMLIQWSGIIQRRFFPIFIGLASSRNSGTVVLNINGKKQNIVPRIDDDDDSISYIRLQHEVSSFPSLHFLCLWSMLTICIFRPLLAFSYYLKQNVSFQYKYIIENYQTLFVIVIIALPVIIFNIQHVFGPHYLLHDDPAFYRIGINHIVHWPFWDKYYSLTAFTEGFSWWIMAHYSPYIVRFLYLLVYMTGISLSIYWLSRRIFNLCPVCSYAAAVLPAIYPLQYEMVAGVNLSYTLISTFFVLLSFIFGFRYLVQESHSWILVFLSGILFALSANLAEHPVFLSAALGFVYLLSSTRWKRKVLLLVLLMVITCAVLYRMIVLPRSAAVPHDLPWDNILSRVKTFYLLVSTFTEGFTAAFILVTVLFSFGMLSFFFYSPLRSRMSNTPHFTWLPEKVRLLILPVFALLWTIPSAFPFVALKQHMPIRTLHIAGYGPWLIMAPGLFFITSIALFSLKESLRKKIVFFVFMFIISTAGIQHLLYAKNVYKNGNIYWETLSGSISFHAFPENSQIVITNASTGTHQTYYQASGYLSRLLGNRTDITGLVGYEYFYYDPFAQISISLNDMTGLAQKDNLHLYRWVQGNNSTNHQGVNNLQPYQYFLRVITDESAKTESEETGDWYLYNIESNKENKLIYTGHGFDEYLMLLNQLKIKNITPEQICWGNPENKFGCNSPGLAK